MNILVAKIAVLAQEIGDRQVTPRDGKNGVLDAQLSALDTATVDGVPLNSRKRSMGYNHRASAVPANVNLFGACLLLPPRTAHRND
ncbi:hypothetical protein [Pseudomonas atacamensis]|uniref:hypothetical protein n=1 Tax=Pseudomonas atacamensis TaxID=2565368 RepID=UPI002B1D0F53|nr:hypothetical protein [Pseudomonas atacamensis]